MKAVILNIVIRVIRNLYVYLHGWGTFLMGGGVQIKRDSTRPRKLNREKFDESLSAKVLVRETF